MFPFVPCIWHIVRRALHPFHCTQINLRLICIPGSRDKHAKKKKKKKKKPTFGQRMRFVIMLWNCFRDVWILVASHEKLLTAYFGKDGRISGTIFYYFWQITKKKKKKKKLVLHQDYESTEGSQKAIYELSYFIE